MKRIFGIKPILFLVFFLMFCWFVWKGLKANENKNDLLTALALNRLHISKFVETFGMNPILKDGNIDFWNLECNQYVWLNPFYGLANIATNPTAMEGKKKTWMVQDRSSLKMRPPNSEDLKQFLNPISGKFDWLAEDASGTLYSPNMPDSLLITSPPIRVVNIRCPLTASEPPYFEDSTQG